MDEAFNEDKYEKALVELFQNNLGYTYIPNIENNGKPIIEASILSALRRINPGLPGEAIQTALKRLVNFDSANVIRNNELFTAWMQTGIETTYYVNSQAKHVIVKLIDYDNPDNNEFVVTTQYTVIEKAERRPDIVVFINGFPLVDIELKSCNRDNTDTSQAYRQIRNRINDIPSFYYYNAFLVISDMRYSKLGSITANEDRFIEWKTINGDYEATKYVDFETFFKGVFSRKRLLDILQNFILYLKREKEKVKIIAQYHQYFAVKKAIKTTLAATRTDGKAGVVWHTTGSGKSLAMVFYAGILSKILTNMTLVVLTDRNDLDNQLYSTFMAARDFLRQTPQQATSRKNLKKLLGGRQMGGLFFTTLQKFEESENVLSERSDIVLIADEAHRNQYGLDERIDKKTGKLSQGFARLVRNSLPNASFIGFTGTPIALKDRNTREVFGDYIDIYDITQAVEDNATCPIYYESRIVRLSLDEKVLKEIDEEYDVLRANADETQIERSKKALARLDRVLGNDCTLNALCTDFIEHYETRQHLLTGKALFVAYSRDIAISIYRRILKIRPEWKNKIKVVATSTNDDPEDWREVLHQNNNELANEFKDDESEFKIAIVVDMWLTGFDLPSLGTMYIFKPMRGHGLIQAISRVNRVFKDKEGGLIVDYAGIATHLKAAMSEYTARDRRLYGNNDISERALPKFLEKIEICQNLMHGFDYSGFAAGTNLERARLIRDGINHILREEETKKAFISESQVLKQVYSLCVSVVELPLRLEFAYFNAIRSSLVAFVAPGKFTIKDINEKINDILKHAVKQGEVINVFDVNDIQFSIFNNTFMKEISKMRQKNLAVEMLKKLLKGELRKYRRTNIVKTELFSEKMQRIINAYTNGQLTNIEVLEELIKLAEAIKADHENANQMGLSMEEQAFYDALIKPQALKDFYQDKNDQLIGLVQELTAALNKNRTIDWQRRETERAKMRKLVKRLLNRFNYPPLEIPDAVVNVINQCEKWADNLEEEDF